MPVGSEASLTNHFGYALAKVEDGRDILADDKLNKASIRWGFSARLACGGNLRPADRLHRCLP